MYSHKRPREMSEDGFTILAEAVLPEKKSHSPPGSRKKAAPAGGELSERSSKRQKTAHGSTEIKTFAYNLGSPGTPTEHIPVTFSVRGTRIITLLQNLRKSAYFKGVKSAPNEFFIDVEPKHFRVFLNYQKFGRFTDNFGFGDVTGIMAVFAELKCENSISEVRQRALKHCFASCSGATLEDRISIAYNLGIPELFCKQLNASNLLCASRLLKAFKSATLSSVSKGGAGVILQGFDGAFFNNYVMFHKGYLNDKPYFESLKHPRTLQFPLVLYFCKKCRNWEVREAALDKIFHKPFTHRSPDFYARLMACPSKPASSLMTDLPWVYRLSPDRSVQREPPCEARITHFMVKSEFTKITKGSIFEGDLSGLLFSFAYLETQDAWRLHLNIQQNEG